MANQTKFQVGHTPWNKGIHTRQIPANAFKKGSRSSPETEFKKTNGNGDRHKAQKYAESFNKCEECEEPFEPTNRKEVHHVDGDIHNNEPENLKVLCNKCHAKTKKKGLEITVFSYFSQARKCILIKVKNNKKELTVLRYKL
jgi:ribosomal protein L34E